MANSTLTKSPLFSTHSFGFFLLEFTVCLRAIQQGSACSCGNRSGHPYVCLFPRLRAVCSEAILILPVSVIYHEQKGIKTLNSPEHARSPLAVPKMYHGSGELPLQGSFSLDWPQLQKYPDCIVRWCIKQKQRFPLFLLWREGSTCFAYFLNSLFILSNGVTKSSRCALSKCEFSP